MGACPDAACRGHCAMDHPSASQHEHSPRRLRRRPFSGRSGATGGERILSGRLVAAPRAGAVCALVLWAAVAQAHCAGAASLPHAQGAALVPPTSAQDGFEPAVQLAKEDLARRLGIDPQAIERREVRPVTWPDRSLGCPRPGVDYPQVQQPGLLIRLRVQGREFAYHSGGARPPFLCEKAA